MSDSRKIRDSFSRAAPEYDDQARLQRVVREECISMAEHVFGPDARILDAGGGTGVFCAEIRERGLNWRVTLLDIAEGMCQAARTHTPEVVNAGVQAMPFADSSFDGIFSSLMLQWCEDALAALREMARVVKPGGRCVISTFAEGTLEELREAFATLDDASHVNRFANPAALTALAAHGGFILLACEEETITTQHADVASLMRALKAIGASTKQEAGRKGLMTPRQLMRLEEVYRSRFAPQNAGNKDLPATWRVLYMILEKQP